MTFVFTKLKICTYAKLEISSLSMYSLWFAHDKISIRCMKRHHSRGFECSQMLWPHNFRVYSSIKKRKANLIKWERETFCRTPPEIGLSFETSKGCSKGGGIRMLLNDFKSWEIRLRNRHFLSCALKSETNSNFVPISWEKLSNAINLTVTKVEVDSLQSGKLS